jgi:streptothricin hydrolase
MSKALFIVDVQFGMFYGDWSLPDSEALLRRLGERLLLARQQAELVVHIQNDAPEGELDAPGEPFWELVLSQRGNERVVRKTTMDAFESNPWLAGWLRDQGVAELELIGVQSELCIRSTAIGATQACFKVHLPEGLHGTYPGEFGGEQLSAAEIISRVQQEVAAL